MLCPCTPTYDRWISHVTYWSYTQQLANKCPFIQCLVHNSRWAAIALLGISLTSTVPAFAWNLPMSPYNSPWALSSYRLGRSQSPQDFTPPETWRNSQGKYPSYLALWIRHLQSGLHTVLGFPVKLTCSCPRGNLCINTACTDCVFFLVLPKHSLIGSSWEQSTPCSQASLSGGTHSDIMKGDIYSSPVLWKIHLYQYIPNPP